MPSSFMQDYFLFQTKERSMDSVKNAVNTLLGRKPAGPKIRYGVVGAGWISQAAFIPGVGQTSNSGKLAFRRLSFQETR